MSTLLPSTDGVRVAVHDLGGPSAAGPDAPVLLFSHATGFHGLVWRAMAASLTDRFRCLAIDYRGHGVAETPETIDFDWRGFGDDCVAVLDSPLLPAGVAVHGVGHSMGGAALVLAADRRPEALRSLWLYEPIVPPPGALLSGDGPNPLAESAIRRRATFPSLEAAYDNYASKPPLNQLRADALRDYVEGGFAPVPDGAGDGGGVALRCRPAWEAATFQMARDSGAWDALATLTLPTAVVVGRDEPFSPAAFAPAIVGALPAGRLVEHRDLGHFGPLEDPVKMAADLGRWVDSVG